MDVPLYQVDAFASRPFTGNPAAVLPFADWPSDATLAAISAENALSNTAFLRPARDGQGPVYDLRWFTPTSEVDLCGHATLAAGHIVLSRLCPDADEAVFRTRWAGTLTVARGRAGYAMALPARPPEPVAAPAELERALGGVTPEAVLRARDLIAVLPAADEVRGLTPDLAAVAGLDCFGLCVTAPGDGTSGADFVSRFFAPQKGISEDPVTGSAHAELAPYWTRRWGQVRLAAAQLSARGGELVCQHAGEQVILEAPVADYLDGTVRVAAL